MSDPDALMQKAQAWLEPLTGDDGPCGPDLEYDNAFLELAKAAEGKPETQFDKGSPPDWRAVRDQCDELFERTRDLRVAMLWLRAELNLDGVAALVPALALVVGLLDTHWQTVHPLPDPDDQDPYARANALAVLPQMEGVYGDLLHASLVGIKGVGQLRLRDVEVALGNLSARDGEPSHPREVLERMLATAESDGAGLRGLLLQSRQSLDALAELMDTHFGAGSRSELRPLFDLLAHGLAMTPEPQAEDDAAAGDTGGADGDATEAGGGAARGGRGPGLSGSVNSRAEAVKAIELVCAYLERHEPTNPAQLFLRRASNLLERNFLELLKELAPNALEDVARMVGVDPDAVGPAADDD